MLRSVPATPAVANHRRLYLKPRHSRSSAPANDLLSEIRVVPVFWPKLRCVGQYRPPADSNPEFGRRTVEVLSGPCAYILTPNMAALMHSQSRPGDWPPQIEKECTCPRGCGRRVSRYRVETQFGCDNLPELVTATAPLETDLSRAGNSSSASLQDGRISRRPRANLLRSQ